MSEVTRFQITIGDSRLSMLVASPEIGEPMVFGHGIPASAELWREGLFKLSAGYHKSAPSLSC